MLWWGFALLLLAALPALAQEEAPLSEPARFLIETITVEGPKEAAANIVRAETLLRPGESYSEEQLRQAVYRIHHLPFVLDASFALRKGSRRGAYELVISVQPARWFFFDHQIRAFEFGEPLNLEESLGNDSAVNADGLVGARLFVGRSGVAFVSLDSDEGVQLGFTQYDLLHRGIIASAGYSRNLCCLTEVLPLALDPSFASWEFDNSSKVSLGLSIPLAEAQSFQVSVSERTGNAQTRRNILLSSSRPEPTFFIGGGGGDLIYRRAEAKWVYDTSDDPILPTRGWSVSAGVEAARFASRRLSILRFDDTSPGFERLPIRPFRSREVVGAVSALRHWSPTARQTLSVQGRLVAGRSEVENLGFGSGPAPGVDVDSYGATVGAQHALTLKRSRGVGRFTDLRLESGVEIGVEKTSPDFGPSPLKRFMAYTGLVFRNQWGRVRATFSYLDLGEVLP
jgi:hypothetical protein